MLADHVAEAALSILFLISACCHSIMYFKETAKLCGQLFRATHFAFAALIAQVEQACPPLLRGDRRHRRQRQSKQRQDYVESSLAALIGSKYATRRYVPTTIIMIPSIEVLHTPHMWGYFGHVRTEPLKADGEMRSLFEIWALNDTRDFRISHVEVAGFNTKVNH